MKRTYGKKVRSYPIGTKRRWGKYLYIKVGVNSWKRLLDNEFVQDPEQEVLAYNDELIYTDDDVVGEEQQDKIAYQKRSPEYDLFAETNDFNSGKNVRGVLVGDKFIFTSKDKSLTLEQVLDEYASKERNKPTLIEFRSEKRDDHGRVLRESNERYFYGVFLNWYDFGGERPGRWNAFEVIKMRGDTYYPHESVRLRNILFHGGQSLSNVLSQIRRRFKNINEADIVLDTEKVMRIKMKASNMIEKSRQGEPLGSVKIWGGKEYIKTPKGWRPKPKGYLGGTSFGGEPKVEIKSIGASAVDDYRVKIRAFIKYKGTPYVVEAVTYKDISSDGKSYEIRPIDNKFRYVNEGVTMNRSRDKVILDALKGATYNDYSAIGTPPVITNVEVKDPFIDSFSGDTKELYNRASAGDVPVSDLIERLIDNDYSVDEISSFVKRKWPNSAEYLINTYLYGNEIRDMRLITKKYVNKTESYKPMSTHISTSYFNDRRDIALRTMQAMKDIQGGYRQGTLTNTVELASSGVGKNSKYDYWEYSSMAEGKNIIQAILDGDTIRYNDGWYIVEVDDDFIYVDVTGTAMDDSDEYNDMKIISDEHIDTVKKSFSDLCIEKAKTYPIGSERTWNGVVYVKTANGWIPKKKGRNGSNDDEKPDTKQRQDNEESSSNKKEVLEGYAKEATDEQLQTAIDKKDQDPEVKEIAEKELESRGGSNEKDDIESALEKLLNHDGFDDAFKKQLQEKLDAYKKDRAVGENKELKRENDSLKKENDLLKKEKLEKENKELADENSELKRKLEDVNNRFVYDFNDKSEGRKALFNNSKLESFSGEYTEKLKSLISKIDVDEEYYKEVLSKLDESDVGANDVVELYQERFDLKDRLAVQKALIEKGKQPIVDGVLFGEFNGEKFPDYSNNTTEDAGDDRYDKEEEELDFSMDYDDALYRYISGYFDPRECIMDPEHAKKRDLERVEEMASFIDKNRVSENVALYRCLDMSYAKDPLILKSFYEAEPGDIISDASFSSFSLRPAYGYGFDMQITLLAKAGDPVANAGNHDEWEYLLQRNTKLRVVAKGLNSMVVQVE